MMLMADKSISVNRQIERETLYMKNRIMNKSMQQIKKKNKTKKQKPTNKQTVK